MAKFNYRFQNILRLKIQLEDQKKTEFSLLQRKIQQERQKLINQEAEMESTIQHLRDSLIGTVNLKTLHYYQNSIAQLMLMIDLQQTLLKNLHQQEHLKRQELTQAMIQRRLYEKIRENRLEEWKKANNAQEQKFLDYLSLNLKPVGQP